MNASLELRAITRSWQPGNPIFCDLSMSVTAQGITVLLGPSGCGKSTLLRCAASLDVPDSGNILVSGNVVTEPSHARQLILQGDDQLLPWLTVGENVSFPVKVNSKGRTSAKHDFNPEKLLETVGLPDSSGLYPSRLSGGMRQRVVLARALAAEPAVLLLDEPFAALDTAIRSRLQILLKNIHRERETAMLLVTHDIAEALILGDNIIFMNSAGRLSDPVDNPLGGCRDSDSIVFHEATIEMRQHYGDLLNPVDG